MYIGIQVNMCYSCHILMKLEFSPQIVEKSSSIQFHENASSGSRVVSCRQREGRNDGHTDSYNMLVVACRVLRKRLKIIVPSVFMLATTGEG